MRYEITEDEEIFQINSSTGVITVKDSTALDRESTDNLTILVSRHKVFCDSSIMAVVLKLEVLLKHICLFSFNFSCFVDPFQGQNV